MFPTVLLQGTVPVFCAGIADKEKDVDMLDLGYL